MFESQGTTPEFQGNPESGVDQLLNRTPSVTIPATLEEALIRGSELQLEILELKQKLDLVTESVETWRSNYFESQDLIAKARRHFEEILSGDMDAQQTYEDFQIPFELLGVEATREVQVTVTASWSGSVQLPYGTDLDDVAMSFTAEFDDLEGSVGWHADDYEIREG